MPVPWTSQVKFQDPATGINVGSPTLVTLGGGDILAAHDYQGEGTSALPKDERYRTSVYRSSDRGLNWQHITDLRGFLWGTMFVSRGSVYLLGTTRGYGDIIIRRSDDGGSTWTDAVDETSGLLFRCGDEYEPPKYHHSPNNVLPFDGRLYTAFENDDPFEWPAGFRAFVLSADEDSNLLKASSWLKSNEVPFPKNDPREVDGWLEGNIVVDVDGLPCSVLRLQPELGGEEYFSGETRYAIDKAAFLKIEKRGRKLINDPERSFVDLPGGMSKFTIRRDHGCRYWTIANDMATGPPRVHRNVLALYSSPDLSTWTRHGALMEDRLEKTPEESARKTGFQYADWQFDGDDIIYVVRTAYDGAANYHDANRITFGRVIDFRVLSHSGERWHPEESWSSPSSSSGSSMRSGS